MSTNHQHNCYKHGWLDCLAVSMAIICAVHCLLMPVLIVLLPIITTTFFVHENFHLWMLFFVIPTTSFAIFMGCRKHKDKLIVLLSGIGILLLCSAAAYELFAFSSSVAADGDACPHCVEAAKGDWLRPITFVNIAAGCFLAAAHVRNYILCRNKSCDHG